MSARRDLRDAARLPRRAQSIRKARGTVRRYTGLGVDPALDVAVGLGAVFVGLALLLVPEVVTLGSVSASGTAVWGYLWLTRGRRP